MYRCIATVSQSYSEQRITWSASQIFCCRNFSHRNVNDSATIWWEAFRGRLIEDSLIIGSLIQQQDNFFGYIIGSEHVPQQIQQKVVSQWEHCCGVCQFWTNDLRTGAPSALIISSRVLHLKVENLDMRATEMALATLHSLTKIRPFSSKRTTPYEIVGPAVACIWIFHEDCASQFLCIRAIRTKIRPINYI